MGDKKDREALISLTQACLNPSNGSWAQPHTPQYLLSTLLPSPGKLQSLPVLGWGTVCVMPPSQESEPRYQQRCRRGQYSQLWDGGLMCHPSPSPPRARGTGCFGRVQGPDAPLAHTTGTPELRTECWLPGLAVTTPESHTLKRAAANFTHLGSCISWELPTR